MRKHSNPFVDVSGMQTKTQNDKKHFPVAAPTYHNTLMNDSSKDSDSRDCTNKTSKMSSYAGSSNNSQSNASSMEETAVAGNRQAKRRGSITSCIAHERRNNKMPSSSKKRGGPQKSYSASAAGLMANTPMIYLFRSKSGSRGSRSARNYLNQQENPTNADGMNSLESLTSIISAITLPDSLGPSALPPVLEADASAKFGSLDNDSRPRVPVRRRPSYGSDS